MTEMSCETDCNNLSNNEDVVVPCSMDNLEDLDLWLIMYWI